MDTPEIGIPQLHGEIRVLGTVHGQAALNCQVIPYASPKDWFFKQFASDYEFNEFVRENGLLVVKLENPPS